MHSPMFTLEVFPPKRNAPVGTIYDTLDGLEGLNTGSGCRNWWTHRTLKR